MGCLLFGLSMVVLVFGLAMFEAWVFMLLWGVIAPNFGWPALDFWTCFCVCFLLHMIGGWFKARRVEIEK